MEPCLGSFLVESSQIIQLFLLLRTHVFFEWPVPSTAVLEVCERVVRELIPPLGNLYRSDAKHSGFHAGHSVLITEPCTYLLLHDR